MTSRHAPSKAQPQPAFGLVLAGDKLEVSRLQQPGFFDPRFLVAAVLDHVAWGDGEVVEEEARAMVDLVAQHFDLDEVAATSRLSHALNLYSQSMDLASVGEVLREVLGPGEREDVMLMLLHVVAADGRQGADELRAVDEVAAVLELTDAERHNAFQRYFAASGKTRAR